MKKKIFIVIFIILFVIFLEFLIYCIYKHKYIQQIKNSDFGFSQQYEYNLKYLTSRERFKNGMLRPPVYIGNKHKILLFGCSYAFGASLDADENFGYLLAKKLDSTVYNRSYPGWGPNYMLFQLLDNNSDINLFSSVNDDIDTVIYVYIDDHVNRQFNFFWGNIFENVYNIRYKQKNLKNGGYKIQEEKILIPFIHSFFISKALHNLCENFINTDMNWYKNTTCMINILKESRKILKDKYPNARFIFISYNSIGITPRKNDIINAGWDYYNTLDFMPDTIDLNDNQYHFKNDPHPTKAAWDVVTDVIVKNKILY